MTTTIVNDPIVLPSRALEDYYESVELPKNGFTIISGPQGSGKSYYVEHPVINWALKEELPTILINFKMVKVLSPRGNTHPWRLEDSTIDALLNEYMTKLETIKGEKVFIVDEPSAFYELESWKEFFNKVIHDDTTTLVVSTQFPELLPNPDLNIVMNGVSVADEK